MPGSAATASWSTSGTSKTISITPSAGETLVMYGGTAFFNTRINTAPTDTSGLTWTARQVIEVSNQAPAYLWTSSQVVSTGAITITLALSSNSGEDWGARCLRFSGSSGVGAGNNTTGSGAPTLNVTTTAANSAIVVFNNDVNTVSGTGRVWRTNAGTFTELDYTNVNFGIAIYGGYHADAGAINTYAVGLSAPTGQGYSIVAQEIMGTAAAAPTTVPPFMGQYHSFF